MYKGGGRRRGPLCAERERPWSGREKKRGERKRGKREKEEREGERKNEEREIEREREERGERGGERAQRGHDARLVIPSHWKERRRQRRREI